jgi:hypothetical protein
MPGIKPKSRERPPCKTERKPRSLGYGRRRSIATERVEHKLDKCPDYGANFGFYTLAFPLWLLQLKLSAGAIMGTETKVAIASLFITWRLLGQDPFLNCYLLLSSPCK